jgi:hypothetical protein
MTVVHTSDPPEMAVPDAAQWRRTVKVIQGARAIEPHYQRLADDINDVLDGRPLVCSDGWTAEQIQLADGSWPSRTAGAHGPDTSSDRTVD